MDDLASTALKARMLRIHEALRRYYGEPELKEQRDPLAELVMTILSQNTNDANSGRAFEMLLARFDTWEAVLEAKPDELADAIRTGGLANVKAPRIQQILRRLRDERGELTLDFLWDMDVTPARAYLLSLPGVGPKTAACVLLFSLHKAALPVDTHVHRVSQRLELTPCRTNAEKAHALLKALVPPNLYYPFHLLFIQHGRTICHARTPRCALCPLESECPFARTHYGSD